MFVYSENYDKMKEDLTNELQILKTKGYHVLTKKHNIVDELSTDKIVIKSKKDAKNRLIFSTGLHGIEGYVGHSCLKTFFKELIDTLSPHTEVVIFHGVNPFGMKNYRRTNENNIDLNRNFSKNNFQNTNKGFDLLKDFFTPKVYRSIKTAKAAYYSALVKLIAKHGVSTLKESTLRGQKVLDEGLYYSGDTIQNSTAYILSELEKIFNDIKNVVWIDLHTGYGPRYQMSIVNSKNEKTSTTDMIKKIQYPLILGMNAEDFYEIDGDMLEKTYDIHKAKKAKCDLFATCFEFGTLGETTLNSISSLKAMVFENNSFFRKQKPKYDKYAHNLIKEQFLPSEEKWRIKAEQDFIQAMKGIIPYKNI